MTLVFILSWLLRYPEHLDRVRDEVAALQTAPEALANQQLHKLSHLNAVISEAQRISAVLPTYSPRMTPAEGLSIDGTFVPGGVEVTCPQYVIHRRAYIHDPVSAIATYRNAQSRCVLSWS